MNYIVLGLKIRQLREQKRLTQMQLAEMIDMSDRTISRIEVGQGEPELHTIVAISKALNISLDYLLSEDAEVGKEMYLHEISERISELELKDLKHILGYIDFYIESSREDKYHEIYVNKIY